MSRVESGNIHFCIQVQWQRNHLADIFYPSHNKINCYVNNKSSCEIIYRVWCCAAYTVRHAIRANAHTLCVRAFCSTGLVETELYKKEVYPVCFGNYRLATGQLTPCGQWLLGLSHPVHTHLPSSACNALQFECSSILKLNFGLSTQF